MSNLQGFKTEYLCQWVNDYDKPINVVEKDNKKILQYELIGLNESHINVKKEWVNKDRKLFLTVVGKFVDEVTEWKNEINIRLEVDYKTYEGIDWNVRDGILNIILEEHLNEEPDVYYKRAIK